MLWLSACLLSMLFMLVAVLGSPHNFVLMFCVRLIVACVIVDYLYAIVVDIAVVWGYCGVHSWVVVGLAGSAVVVCASWLCSVGCFSLFRVLSNVTCSDVCY